MRLSIKKTVGRLLETGDEIRMIRGFIMFRFFRKMLGGGEVDCKEVHRLSSEYLEEELPAAKQSAIQLHLSKCGPCKFFVETLASTIGLLSRLPRLSAPPGFKQSLIDRTRGEGDNSAV